jgi:hypothetical protein
VIAFILCFTCKLHAIPSFWIGSERSNTPFSIERIEANESSYAFRVTINSIIDSSVVHNGEVYHYLQLEEGYFLNNVGQPQLPVITQLANIPKNATYTTSLLEEEWTTIHVGKNLPSQRDYLEASNGAPVDSGGTNATNRQVVDQINSGMNIVTYRGHGWTYLWGPWWNASNEHFYDEYVDSLNDGTNSIYFSICCQTGDITNNPCMLHRFMRSGHGAVSFLGFTTDSFHVPNQNFSRNIFISLLRDQVYTLGDLIVSSITKNLKISYSSIGAYNAYSLLCGGDPTLEIWTHKPYRFENVEVSVLSDTIRIAMGNDIDFQYSVVSEEGELLSKGISNEQTCKVRRPSNNFYISIYKHNYLPRILYFNSESLYLQNKIIADEEYYTNSPFSIGYDVTTTLPPGDVIVRDGAKLSIEKGSDGVFIKNGFEIEKGAEFHIK